MSLVYIRITTKSVLVVKALTCLERREKEPALLTCRACSVLNFALPIENEGSEERRQGLSGPRSAIRCVLAFALIKFVLLNATSNRCQWARK